VFPLSKTSRRNNIEEMSSKTIVSNNISVNDGGCILFTSELGPNDVLLGRGTGPNEHIGNVRFRSLVRESIQRVDLSTPGGKSELTKKIVNTVKERNGKFLKRVNIRKKNAGNIFVEVPDRVSLEKTKQSFRQHLRAAARGDKEIKYRAKFPRSLIERKSKARAVNKKPCAPNANAAAIEQEHPRSSDFDRNLNGPKLSGIVDPDPVPLFVGKLIRGELGATNASIMASSPRLADSILVSPQNAAQILSFAIRRELISNRILFSEFMGGYHSMLPAPLPGTIAQQAQRPAMPTTLSTFPLPGSALLDFILQGHL
jgi:hypothetical protein